MLKSTIKRLNIVVTREVLERFLSDFLILGCTEFSEALDLADNSELNSFVKRELVDLTSFGVGKDCLSVLGTKYTVMFTGWLPSRFELELTPILKKHGCAWEISEPMFGDVDIAPVELVWPWFFRKHRLAGRKEFTPLRVIEKSSEETIGSEDDEII